jgi:hypothetical protein
MRRNVRHKGIRSGSESWFSGRALPLPGSAREVSGMIAGYFILFFFFVFVVAMGLTTFYYFVHDRVRRRRPPRHPHKRFDPPPPSPGQTPSSLSEFERSVLRDIYGMTDEEIRLSEAMLRLRKDTDHTYVTSNDRPDGFFEA